VQCTTTNRFLLKIRTVIHNLIEFVLAFPCDSPKHPELMAKSSVELQNFKLIPLVSLLLCFGSSFVLSLQCTSIDSLAMRLTNKTRQSFSRVAIQASRSLSRSASLRTIGVASSHAQSITRAFVGSSQSVTAVFAQRRLYSKGPDTTEDAPPAQFGANYNANETLYVGNLFFDTTPDQLRAFFSAFGTVETVNIPTDIRGFVRG
jgi:hypothetical protein